MGDRDRHESGEEGTEESGLLVVVTAEEVDVLRSIVPVRKSHRARKCFRSKAAADGSCRVSVLSLRKGRSGGCLQVRWALPFAPSYGMSGGV